MKILMLSHYWRPHRGGIETVAFEQARKLVQKGHSVTVISSRLKNDPSRSDEDGIRVFRVNAFNPFEKYGIPYPLFSPYLFLLTFKLISENDVVIAHSHTFLSSMAASVAAFLRKKPFLIFQQNTLMEYSFPWDCLQFIADALIGRFTLQQADHCLAASSESRKYVLSLKPDAEVSVLHNGVDTKRFSPLPDSESKQSIRKRLGLPETDFIALCVRRLVFKNGIGTLAEAAKGLVDHKDLKIVIGGSGPERQKLAALIQNNDLKNIIVPGFIEDADLPDYYRCADVFVLPSASGEGLPMVLLEAFSTGIPVIGTRAGGQIDLIKDNQTGWLIPRNDPKKLIEAIKDSYRDKPATKQMGINARVLANSLDWDIHVSSLLDHLQKALDRNQKS